MLVDILEFNYEWRCIHVIIDWSVIILYDFNKDLGSKKKLLALLHFFLLFVTFNFSLNSMWLYLLYFLSIDLNM